MPNRLANETSPYLLQHAGNPVDWQPWGEAALSEAARRNVPLLVSIGYAACHWCHVMEHESFSDPGVAELMNRDFVCVKVDREERPDVDALFMEACQLLNGHGGWPLNAFATPDGKPFWVGTYFPPVDTVRSPSWRTVLSRIADAWREEREGALAAGERLVGNLIGAGRLAAADATPGSDVVEGAVETLIAAHDPVNGGFGGAPKFPPHEALLFLIAAGERDVSLSTLRAIAAGGIHDQVGGGFCRYAVDAAWTVPHFEKMLYDNALLAVEFLNAWRAGGDKAMLDACRSTLAWMERDLLGPEGGFHASLDADDPLGEGRFYSWTPTSVAQALGQGADAELACELFGITEQGNFEDGLTVPTDRGTRAVDSATRDRLRAGLLAARDARPAPAVDTKVITSWNALAISAFAQAGTALGDRRLVGVAADCASHLLEKLRDPSGRLMRCRTAGRAVIPAVLEDHAFLLDALLDLHEATFEPRWFEAALELEEVTWERFGDPSGLGYFTSARDGEQLAARRKEIEDHPIPSGQSAMALALTRLHGLTGDSRHLERADGVLRLLASVAGRAPLAAGRVLRTLLLHTRGLDEVAIVGPDPEPLLSAYRSAYRPTAVVACADAADRSPVPLLAGRVPESGETAAWVCRGFACRQPVTTPDALLEQLRSD